MAGETEDCITYQADLLPTGSISFGRFEVESLSWERRSSFSHNRYLEEVEKYSTPGSVTQKRAILEAHFKKKPLVPQTSLEHQDEGEYQATKNHVGQETSCFEEFVDHDNGHPEFAWYDDTPAASDETEIMEGEEEENSPFERISYSDEKVLHPSSELSDLDETLQPQVEHVIKPSNKDKLCVVVEPEPDNKAVIVEELLEKREDFILDEVHENREDIIVEEVHENRGISSRSSTVESKNVNSLKKTQKASPKVNEAVEQKTAKIKRTQLPVQQNLRNSSTKSFVTSVTMRPKSMEKEERDNTLRTKSVKQSPSRTSMTSTFDSKNLMSEPSHILTAKVRKEKRSVKDVQAKKGVTKAHSISGKSEMDIHQPSNRPKEVATSAKEEAKQNGFSFKCEERAERRKEYYTKLEEKLHAKEAEMNEIQARTQEETEAQIKQFRRSLNFKATPMPSFYHESVPRVSEGKKKLVTPTKPQKLQSKSTSPGSRSNREKSPAVSNPANRESPAHEPNRTIESPQKIEAGKKDDRSRSTVQQQRESTPKKPESLNKTRGVRRKAVKNGIVTGNVAVHVAS